MLISELNLIAFGKFKNKIIKLKDGINIIYGKNEAGKTTIHKFIEGMFYGFFRPYTRIRRYSQDYERYFPWNFNEYRGALKYKLDGNIYRLERNFIKTKDEVKMYDDITGDDITYLLEYDNVLRLPLPGPFLLGINNPVVYNNTVNIKQLGSETDENLSKEVKDSLANLSDSLDEDISIKNALNYLEEKKDEIGTERRTTSPYGQLIIELENLYEKREKTSKIHDEILEIGEKLKFVREEVKDLEREKLELISKIDEIESFKKFTKYKKAMEIKEKIENLEKEKVKIKKYSNLSSKDYEEILSIYSQVKILEENIFKWKENIDKLRNEINILEKELEDLNIYTNIDEEEMENVTEYLKELCILKKKKNEIEYELGQLENFHIDINKEKLKDLNEDIYYYEDMERRRDKLEFSKDETNILILKGKKEDYSKKLKKKNNLIKLFSILSIISIGLGFIIPIAFIFLILFIIGVVYIRISKGNITKEEKKVEEQINKIQTYNKDIDYKIREIDEELERLLDKYNCKTRKELKRLYTENYEESINISRKYKEIENLNRERVEFNRNIEDLVKRTEKYRNLFNIEENYTIEDIKTIEKEYKEYLNFKNKLNYKLEDKDKYVKNLKEDEKEKTNILDKINTMLKKNNCETLDDFKEGLEKKKKLEKINSSLKLYNLDLEKTLGDMEFETLKSDIENYDHRLTNYELIDDIESLEKELDQIKKEINNKKIYIAKLEESTFLKSEEITPLVEIDEKIESLKLQKEFYENKMASINLARNTIEKISKNVHKEFAPTLNREVSNIVKKITDNKYKDIKINENIDISVVEPGSGEIKDIYDLSGGTIDQLYFATRFAIIDIITNRKVPLILDDCFIQYDRGRLTNILDLLGDKSKERQIILFTCHEREGEIFDELGIKYNLIVL